MDNKKELSLGDCKYCNAPVFKKNKAEEIEGEKASEGLWHYQCLNEYLHTIDFCDDD